MVLSKTQKYIALGGAMIFGIYLLRNAIFGAEQMAYLRKLNPKAKKTFRDFIKRVKKETGYRIIITSGYRTFAKQSELNKANSSNAKAGRSFHNYGMAIDINAVKGTKWLRKSSSRGAWVDSNIINIAKEMGLRWGGDFSGYYDPVHFDLGNKYSTSELLKKAEARFGTNPNNIKGNLV